MIGCCCPPPRGAHGGGGAGGEGCAGVGGVGGAAGPDSTAPIATPACLPETQMQFPDYSHEIIHLFSSNLFNNWVVIQAINFSSSAVI